MSSVNRNSELVVDDDDRYETISEGESEDIGGIRVSSYSRGQAFVKSLPPYVSAQLRTWRMINGPLDDFDKRGKFIHFIFQTSAMAFIVLVILETEPHVYNHNTHIFELVQRILAIIITIEYFLSLWSVTANPEYSKGRGRLRWASSFLPFVDMIVILCYWSSQILSNGGSDRSLDEKIIRGLQTLRLLRLLRMFEVIESERVKKAFRLLYRVMRDKGEDIMASLIIMFVSLIFIATLMYLVEGSHEEGFDSFQSIPVCIYWGIITLTTIGYGDIYPKTTMGQVVCCFVGFFAVCIGGIPIGIIGAGYVEELEKSRKEAKAAANRGISFVDKDSMMNSSADKHVTSINSNSSKSGISMSESDAVAMTLSGLRIHAEKAADIEFLSALTQKELEEVSELLSNANRELNAFVMSELGILRRQHFKALNPL